MKIYSDMPRIAGMLGVAFVATMGLGMAGCTYTQLAPPPAYVEYVEPEPVYYDGPFADLSSWGTWIDTGPFGWVWRPYSGADWQPYYYGNWMWTQWGWTWVSYEPFGWAAYHYGFWHYDAIYGWIWVPDDQWFPTRVTWMYYGDYIYWAPIPPPGYYIPDPWAIHSDFIWVGVSVDHFTQSDVGRYRIKDSGIWANVPRGQIRRDTPRVDYIERRTRSKINVVDVTRHKVKVGSREYEQMILPPAEQKTVERYKDRREEFVRPQPKPQPKPQPREQVRPTEQPKQKSEPAKQPEKREPQPKSKSKNGQSQEKDQKKDQKGGKEKEKGSGKGK
jgi:Family of unknown function (DUF6600)